MSSVTELYEIEPWNNRYNYKGQESIYNVNTMSLQSNARKACDWNRETWAASGNTSPSLITRTDLGNKEAYDQTENI